MLRILHFSEHINRASPILSARRVFALDLDILQDGEHNLCIVGIWLHWCSHARVSFKLVLNLLIVNVCNKHILGFKGGESLHICNICRIKDDFIVICITLFLFLYRARANNVKDHSKKNFLSISFDMKRTLKSGHRNVTLKTQIAFIKAQIAVLQAYHKKLGTQNKNLETFKIELQSKINQTHAQSSKLLKLQKQIKKFEIKMIKLSLQMKTLEAKIATAQTELKSLEKQFKEIFKNNKNLMRTQIRGKNFFKKTRERI